MSASWRARLSRIESGLADVDGAGRAALRGPEPRRAGDHSAVRSSGARRRRTRPRRWLSREPLRCSTGGRAAAVASWWRADGVDEAVARLDLQPHRALPGRPEPRRSGGRGDAGRSARARTSPPRCTPRERRGAAPLPRGRPASTRSSPARPRSRGRSSARRRGAGRGHHRPDDHKLFRGRWRPASACGARRRSPPATPPSRRWPSSGARGAGRAAPQRHVVIVGAGETSEQAARDLPRARRHYVFVTNRRRDRALALAERFGGAAARSTSCRRSWRAPTSWSPPPRRRTRSSAPRLAAVMARARGPAAAASSTSPCRATSTRGARDSRA